VISKKSDTRISPTEPRQPLGAPVSGGEVQWKEKAGGWTDTQTDARTLKGPSALVFS
jgi:hypothetical protein